MTTRIRRSGTPSATPSSLLHGELALNYADGKLFWKDAAGTIRSFSLQDEVVEYQATSNFPATGSTTLLYLATDASRAYRWTGSEYVEVGTSTLSASGSSGSVAGSRALLDLVSAAAAAYSLRNLFAGSTTAVVRVRRSNDDAERDFNGAEVLDGSLAAFVGAGNNGFVRTWYDQSGSGRHVGQATTSLQPSIVSSGSVLLLNGLPAIDWPSNSANKVLTSTISTSTAITTLAIFSAVRRSGGYSKLYNLGVDDGLSGYAFTPIVGTSFNDWTDTNTGFIGKGFDTGEAPRILSTGTPIPSSATTQNMIFATLSSATSRMFRNKAEVSYGVQSTGNCSALTNVTLYLGNNEASVQQFIGRMQEVVIWSSNKFADRTTAETDAGAYYGIA